ncbi:lysylphosphatidylglycerol synthase transmembrane domain-containing protein [Falsirhodobacter deserti]|uniref:lysylphosphatidylglycerol synthase transmembrane domain-containing protein n=1 Tax=Falsirhodobacter deserti TaxID=1365611 RepID=UPI0013E3505A|nr:lysylphosphatidylglycerol synthase transmembrane domain-containing protein [Falsirhodobacter deserti]
MKFDTQAPIWRMMRVVLPLVILAALWVFADGAQIVHQLRRADLGWLIAAGLVVNLQTVLCGWRWKMTANRLGQALPLTVAIREYYLAQFVNQTMPGGVAGDVARAVRVKGDSMARSGAAVAIERISGQVGMLVIMIVALAIALLTGAVPSGTGGMPLGIGIGIAVALPIAYRLIPQRMREAIRRGILDIWARQSVLGLAISACNILAFSCCAEAIGAPLEPLAAAALVPVVLSAMLIPASVAGWGFREGAAVLFLPAAGLGAQAAVATSVAYGAVLLVSAIPGAFFLRRPRKLAGSGSGA